MRKSVLALSLSTAIIFLSMGILYAVPKQVVDATNFPTAYQCSICGDWHPYGTTCPKK